MSNRPGPPVAPGRRAGKPGDGHGDCPGSGSAARRARRKAGKRPRGGFAPARGRRPPRGTRNDPVCPSWGPARGGPAAGFRLPSPPTFGRITVRRMPPALSRGTRCAPTRSAKRPS
jgi:hypothetical protein